jgi:ATP-binding cassette subfamily A (ABC1) protein 3
MILLDSILYTVIAWYLNQVISGEYGVAKPLNFCFKLSYWRKHNYEQVPNQRVY